MNTPHTVLPPPPTPGAPYMGTIPLPEVDPTMRVGMNFHLTPSAPKFPDFSVSTMPFDARLDRIPAPVQPTSFLVFFPTILHTISFGLQPPKVVSVWAVLNAVHHFLHKTPPTELLNRPENAGAPNQFFARLMAIKNLEEKWDQPQRGVKYVDLLGWSACFCGTGRAGRQSGNMGGDAAEARRRDVKI